MAKPKRVKILRTIEQEAFGETVTFSADEILNVYTDESGNLLGEGESYDLRLNDGDYEVVEYHPETNEEAAHRLLHVAQYESPNEQSRAAVAKAQVYATLALVDEVKALRGQLRQNGLSVEIV